MANRCILERQFQDANEVGVEGVLPVTLDAGGVFLPGPSLLSAGLAGRALPPPDVPAMLRASAVLVNGGGVYSGDVAGDPAVAWPSPAVGRGRSRSPSIPAQGHAGVDGALGHTEVALAGMGPHRQRNSAHRDTHEGGEAVTRLRAGLALLGEGLHSSRAARDPQRHAREGEESERTGSCRSVSQCLTAQLESGPRASGYYVRSRLTTRRCLPPLSSPTPGRIRICRPCSRPASWVSPRR